MSYFRSRALGATADTSFRWITTAGGTKICWSDRLNKRVINSLCPEEEKSTTDKLQDAAGAVASWFTDKWKAEGAAQAAQQQAMQQQQQQGTPKWVVPAALGVGAVGLVLVLRKRKKSK